MRQLHFIQVDLAAELRDSFYPELTAPDTICGRLRVGCREEWRAPSSWSTPGLETAPDFFEDIDERLYQSGFTGDDEIFHVVPGRASRPVVTASE